MSAGRQEVLEASLEARNASLSRCTPRRTARRTPPRRTQRGVFLHNDRTHRSDPTGPQELRGEGACWCPRQRGVPPLPGSPAHQPLLHLPRAAFREFQTVLPAQAKVIRKENLLQKSTKCKEDRRGPFLHGKPHLASLPCVSREERLSTCPQRRNHSGKWGFRAGRHRCVLLPEGTLAPCQGGGHASWDRPRSGVCGLDEPLQGDPVARRLRSLPGPAPQGPGRGDTGSAHPLTHRTTPFSRDFWRLNRNPELDGPDGTVSGVPRVASVPGEPECPEAAFLRTGPPTPAAESWPLFRGCPHPGN